MVDLVDTSDKSGSLEDAQFNQEGRENRVFLWALSLCLVSLQ